MAGVQNHANPLVKSSYGSRNLTRIAHRDPFLGGSRRLTNGRLRLASLAGLGLLLGLGLGASVATAQSASSYYAGLVRSPPIDEDYFAGYLTWTSKGEILWGREGSVETGGPGGDAAGMGLSDAGWMMRTNTGNRAGGSYIRTDTFESEPLPRDLHINASRTLALQVCVTNNGPAMEAQVFVGDEFLAGGIPGVNRPATSPYPQTSTGQCHVLRMHPELDFLAKGSKLTVKVSPHNYFLYNAAPAYLFRYKAYCNPACAPEIYGSSVLHIPVLPDYELALRKPQAGPGDPSAGEGEGTPVGPASPPLLPWSSITAVAAPLLGLGRRRKDVMLLLIVLGGSSLAGCVGSTPASVESETSAPPATGGTASVTTVPTGTGTGSIVGQVSNPLRQAIVGAHVSLLNTGRFTDTGAGGSFRFQNLSAGTYQARVEAAGYKVFEGTFLVTLGNITTAEITLDWREERSGDAAPHAHDRWIPDIVKTIFDREVAFPTSYGPLPGGVAACHTSIAGEMCAVDLDFANQPENPKILPGVRDIEVEISWDSSPNTVERAGIGYSLPGALWNGFRFDEMTFLYPKPSGETTHIRTSWELADDGHATFSGWHFFLYIPANPGALVSPSATTQVATTSFHVVIRQHKGVIPLERAHPDWWGPNSTLAVVADVEALVSCFAYCTWPAATRWTPEPLVPSDTLWLEVTLEQLAARGPLSPSWGMLYHPGNRKAPTANTDHSHFKPMATPTKDGLKWTLRQPLPAGDADGIYARHSEMAFAVTDLAPPLPGAPYQVYTSQDASPGTWRLRLTVIAHKDPMPSS